MIFGSLISTHSAKWVNSFAARGHQVMLVSYPIQQKKVKQMINKIKDDSNVEKIVVFGSSVQDTCHMGSDVDFYIVLKQDQKITFKETLSFMYDIWTNYTVDSRMYEEITKKGVTVYERDIAG